MSIADNYIPVVEAGNGVTTVFTGDWNPVELGSLRVYLQDVLTGVQTLQVQGVDYNAALVSTGGFRVTFITAPTADYLVVIARVTDQDQDVPYRTSKGFDGANIERSYDKLTAMVQELQDETNRALKFPLGSTAIGQIVGIPADETVLMFVGTSGDVTSGPSLTAIMNAAAEAIAAAASAAAALISQNAAAASATSASNSALLAQSWAVDDIVARPEGSAKYWAEQAQIISQTGDYVVFGPAALTLNQALGTDYITLPVDPKIAARVTLILGGVTQIAGTDYTLDAAPDTNRLRIVGGTSALQGVIYGGIIQLPTSLTNINAPSAGSVVTTTIQNGAVDLTTKVSGNLPVTNLNSGTNANAGTVWRGDGTWGTVGPQSSANLPSTSGTSVVATGIPASAKHISVLLSGVSTSGTSPVQVNIGVGSLQVTGYDSRVTSAAAGGTNSNTSNTGFPLHSTANSTAASTLTGRVDIYKMSSTVWVCSATLHDISGTFSLTSSGTCVVVGNIDRVGIRATNGTDTFDGGSITVMWE